jgi:hypothetical protein
MKHSNAWYGTVAALFTPLLFWSCSDDPISGKIDPGDNTIKFSAWLKASEAQSRTANSKNIYSRFDAYHLDNSDMYLCAAVEPKIDSKEEVDTTASNVLSRGTLVDESNITSIYQRASILAYGYDNTTYATYDFAYEHGGLVQYINNAYLKPSKSGETLTWTSSPTLYWTSKKNSLVFYMFMPTVADFYGTEAIPTTDAPYVANTAADTPPTITYHTPEDVTKQKDIMCASSAVLVGDGSTCGQEVYLPVYHATAALSIKLSTSGFANKAIRKITIKNIITKGTHYVGSSAWDVSSTREDRSVEFSANDVNELTGANVMMLIPQTLTTGNSLEITVVDKTTGAEKNYSMTFTDETAVELNMGETTHLVLSATAEDVTYVLAPEFTEINFSYNGTPAGDGDAATDGRTDLGYTRLKSYKMTTSGSGTNIETKYEAVAWTGTVSSNSAIVSEYPKSNTDGATAISGAADGDYNFQFKPKLTVQAGTTKPSNDAQQFAKRAAAKTLGTKDEPLDLTYYKSDGTHWTTAEGNRFSSNCYMINYPGWYEIPIICGPTINKDTDMENTFILGTNKQNTDDGYTNYGYLNNFVNYNEDPLISGWIQYWATNGDKTKYYPKANDGTTQDTYIEWTDTPGSVELTYNYTRKVWAGTWPNYASSYYLLRFHVPSNAKPGNTVISVRNTNDQVLWSYHIWVTSYTTDSTFTAQPNEMYSDPNTPVKFLKVPLGYVEEDYNVYPAREAKLLITQAESGKTAEITLKQDYHECRPQSCCYYQWGRKDPFPGGLLYETGHLNHDDSYTIGYKEKTITSDVDRYKNGIDYAPATTLVSSGILYPLTFFTGFQQPAAPNHYFDLWGCLLNKVAESSYGGGLIHYTTSAAGSSSRKAAYDPCPPSFKVPPVYAMPQFTKDGKNHTSTYDPLVKELSEEEELYNTIANTPYKTHEDFINNLGFEFYGNRMAEDGTKSGDLYKLHAFGMRSCSDGSITGLGQHCYYWTCTRWVAGTGATNTRIYYLHCGYSGGGSTFAPSECNTNTYGMPVLPMFAPDL